MKFLCVSDQIDPFVYSTTAKERYKDIDGVIAAGDLPLNYLDFIVTTLNKPLYFVYGNHDLKGYDYYKGGQKGLDFNSQMKNSCGGDYVSNKVIRDKRIQFADSNGKKSPLLIAGVSGSKKYNNGADQWTEGQMKRQLMKLVPKLIMNKIIYGRYLDIFVTHASPRHIHDKEDLCHQGFQCFNWFIKKFSPSLFVHGHIHLYDLQAKRMTNVKNTTVLNAFSRVIVQIDQHKQGDESGVLVSVDTNR